MAPERCVQYERGVAGTLILVGVDAKGVVRVRVMLASDDVSSWWLKVIRHWLAWAYGASEIKIVS